MAIDQHMGALYPFSLAQKLEKITESHPVCGRGQRIRPGPVPSSPEMISVLTQYTSDQASFGPGSRRGAVRGSGDQALEGPLFVDHPYLLERRSGLSESRRTESNWILTRVYDGEDRSLVAEVILNSATLKDSYANYAADAAALDRRTGAGGF